MEWVFAGLSCKIAIVGCLHPPMLVLTIRKYRTVVPIHYNE